MCKFSANRANQKLLCAEFCAKHFAKNDGDFVQIEIREEWSTLLFLKNISDPSYAAYCSTFYMPEFTDSTNFGVKSYTIDRFAFFCIKKTPSTQRLCCIDYI